MSKLKVLAFSILLILILATAAGCERIAPFQIENATSETISIVIVSTDTDYTSGEGIKPVCKIKPGKICKPEERFADLAKTYLIEARDDQGNVIYSKLFSNQELRDMHWKVTITESGN